MMAVECVAAPATSQDTMPSGWERVRLGEVLRKSGDWIDLQPEQEYAQVTVRLWGKGAALRGRVQGAEIAAGRQLRVHRDQFILSRIDARNGAFGLVPADLDGAVVSNDFPTFDLDTTRIVPGLLGWMSRTHDFVELCKRASEGTTNRVRLQEDRFLAAEIALPSPDEQRGIVARIEALAARIAEARELRREATELAAEFVVSMHLELAKGRRVGLSDVLTLDEHREEIVPGAMYPQIGIKGFGGGLFDRQPVSAEQTTYRTFNRLYAGAVVLSQVKGWEGAIAVCDARYAGKFASPEYRTFRCKPDQALPEYLAALVVTPWFYGQLGTLTRGVGARRERTRPEHFLGLEMPMPTIEQQAPAVTAFAHLAVLKRQQDEVAAELEALLPAVLDRAFRGEL